MTKVEKSGKFILGAFKTSFTIIPLCDSVCLQVSPSVLYYSLLNGTELQTLPQGTLRQPSVQLCWVFFSPPLSILRGGKEAP